MITGINHINLSVSDIERSFHFYHQLLGLNPICKWPYGAYFLAGNDWFCLNVTNQCAVSSTTSYTHYAFTVNDDDFTNIVAKLCDAGIESFKNNRSEGKSFYFLDPDGHKLELHVGDWKSRLASKKLQPWPNTKFFM